MAETARDWVLGMAHVPRLSSIRGDVAGAQMRVEEVVGGDGKGGFTLVRGGKVGSEEDSEAGETLAGGADEVGMARGDRWLLIGEPTVDASHKGDGRRVATVEKAKRRKQEDGKVTGGTLVRIGLPSWKVDVKGEIWTVGLKWRVEKGENDRGLGGQKPS